MQRRRNRSWKTWLTLEKCRYEPLVIPEYASHGIKAPGCGYEGCAKAILIVHDCSKWLASVRHQEIDGWLQWALTISRRTCRTIAAAPLKPPPRARRKAFLRSNYQSILVSIYELSRKTQKLTLTSFPASCHPLIKSSTIPMKRMVHAAVRKWWILRRWPSNSSPPSTSSLRSSRSSGVSSFSMLRSESRFGGILVLVGILKNKESCYSRVAWADEESRNEKMTDWPLIQGF